MVELSDIYLRLMAMEKGSSCFLCVYSVANLAVGREGLEPPAPYRCGTLGAPLSSPRISAMDRGKLETDLVTTEG